ncbi:hypothetical protein C2869_04235 [Saccharobesus litoralis]|uniref:SSD domain-containing protein n=1 Tax=Saccharobesus litoralis TaxID=2172099 RepID=A0A2S0VN96_9ALTE|nr:efflux RND transporter permease subunit [Saccharobesus litoralis]AWB65694.1 hypothetical protein C2869_04235 [Saccharobesus litoralis]
MKLLVTLRNFFEQVPDWSLRYKAAIWTFFIAGTVFMAAGISKITVDTSMDSVFPEGHPVRESYIEFREQFGSDKVLSILYRAKDGDIFSEQSLKTLHAMHYDLVEYRDNPELRETSALKHIDQIIDLINVSFLESSQETVMKSRHFIGKDLPNDQAGRDFIRFQANEHKDYPKTFFDKNNEYGLIFLTTDFGAIPKGFDKDQVFFEEEEFALGNMSVSNENAVVEKVEFEEIDNEECSKFMAEIRAILEKPEYKQVFDIYYVGDIAMYAFDHDVIGPEVGMIFSCTILLFFVILAVLFRRGSAIVWALVIDVAAVIWLMGTMGWVGTTMSELINPIILLTLIVGIADSVHVISGYMFSRKLNRDHRQSLRATMRKSGVACFLTTVTTGIGFVALSSVDLIELRVFGVYAAVGIFWAFFLTVLMLPLMLDLWAPMKKDAQFTASAISKSSFIQKMLAKVNAIVIARPKTIVAVSFALIVVLVPGVTMVKVDTNPILALKENTEVRQAFEVMEGAMSGSQSMHILIDTKVSGGIRDLQVLQVIEDMEQYVINHESEYLVDAGSLLIALKNSYKAVNHGDLTYYRMPETQELANQLFFLFQNADPESNRMLVSEDYSLAHIGIILTNEGSASYVDVIADLKAEAARKFAPLYEKYPDMQVQFTGDLAVQMEMYDMMSWAQIKSFSLAFIIVTLVLLLLFGSWKLGLIAMVPNVIPVLVTFGLMGWFGIPLDIVALIIAPIVIGIVVDDTIHFFTHYNLVMKETGDIEKAVGSAIREVGQALIVTTCTLSGGLLFMMYSSHMGFTFLGLLGAVAIFVALIADLFLFPALCLLSKIKPSQSVLIDNDKQQDAQEQGLEKAYE